MKKGSSAHRFYSIFLCALLILTALTPLEARNQTGFSTEEQKSLEMLHPRLPSPFPKISGRQGETQVFPLPDEIAPWPTEEWSVSSPEEEGMDRNTLTRAFQYAIRHDSSAVLVIRNGYIVGEWYAEGWDETTRQQGFSVTKSFTGALVGILIDNGAINDPEQHVADFVTDWNDLQHGPVMIKNLLSMNSGLHWNLLTDVRLGLHPNQMRYAIGLPMDHVPNEKWVYHNSACQVLSEVIFQSSGMQAADYARDQLFDLIGMKTATWQSDKVGNTLTYTGIVASAREFAKFGYLFLRNGLWEDRQIISEHWVAKSTQQSQEQNPFYGYLWWLNTGQLWWQDVPKDAFAAMGLNERRIYVVPSLDIIAVRLGENAASWSDNTFLGLISASAIRK
ncbi:MAG: beta-lactamase family protein [Candidatus Brocadiaceae bacterium]|nr:beta-lactamase family protein [Candidatus Brocadiaceae bacterium]